MSNIRYLSRRLLMDTVIIGAGASGLACAVRLKQNDSSNNVTLLERMPFAGKKILATGNGRCNLSNINAQGFEQVIDFFNSIGLVTRDDGQGRIYPYSNTASTVAQALINECKKLKVNMINDCNVTAVDAQMNVISDKGIFKGDNIVIACGGMAQPGLGSNGSGYALLKGLGHTITPLYPALVQLTSSSKYPRILKGKRVKCNIAITINDVPVKEDYGEVLFTPYGLSGIAVMNLSDIVSLNFAKENPDKCHAVLNLIPEMSEDDIKEYLKKYNHLDGILGSSLASIIEKQSGYDIEKTAQYTKSWKLIITGTKGYDFAQITGGGAELSEFDNYQSKLVKGIYACGEILDRQFECGGFNLNFAWYSGIKTADLISDKRGMQYDKN